MLYLVIRFGGSELRLPLTEGATFPTSQKRDDPCVAPGDSWEIGGIKFEVDGEAPESARAVEIAPPDTITKREMQAVIEPIVPPPIPEPEAAATVAAPVEIPSVEPPIMPTVVSEPVPIPSLEAAAATAATEAGIPAAVEAPSAPPAPPSVDQPESSLTVESELPTIVPPPPPPAPVLDTEPAVQIAAPVAESATGAMEASSPRTDRVVVSEPEVADDQPATLPVPTVPPLEAAATSGTLPPPPELSDATPRYSGVRPVRVDTIPEEPLPPPPPQPAQPPAVALPDEVTPIASDRRMAVESGTEILSKSTFESGGMEKTELVGSVRLPKLIVTFEGTTFEHTVAREITNIGRDQSNDLCLPDTSVSRYHSSITRGAGGAFTIKDLNSTNGTIVNGDQVEATVLKHGDLIELGSYRIKIEMPDEAPQIAAPPPPKIQAAPPQPQKPPAVQQRPPAPPPVAQQQPRPPAPPPLPPRPPEPPEKKRGLFSRLLGKDES